MGALAWGHASSQGGGEHVITPHLGDPNEGARPGTAQGRDPKVPSYLA
jgi:hypothetical protein